MLKQHCLSIEHIGSTAVVGLSAKPKIDMMLVVPSFCNIKEGLASIGFFYRGQYNIPMRLFFTKQGSVNCNLHVYQEGNPEIKMHLVFRDYLRKQPKIREQYAK